jgi:sialic acid synthase SpsE/quercetin dioxygenase-like cupin family protein
MSGLFRDLFIFDMANNHEGSVDHGLGIINAVGKIARQRGIRGGIKFQYRDLDSLIHPDFRARDDVKHVRRFLSTRLTETEFLTLLQAVRDQGLITVVTPFDEPSVDTCLDHGVQIIKVASCSANDWPLLEKIAASRKPVIVSTGGLSIYDIDNVVSFLTHKEVELALMHCVALYPTPNDKVQMGFLGRMIKRYPRIPIGYSGHEKPDNLDVVKIAVSKGATILERHVGLPTETIELNQYSMTPEQTAAWVASALVAREICDRNGYDKQISQAEVESLLSLKRGVYAAVGIKQGDVVRREDVFFAMPCVEGQTTSGDFGRYRTKWIASKDYQRNEPILEYQRPDIPDTVGMVRGIIHDAKGMLYEANIEVGRDLEIELSHHYGLEHFRHIGALIIKLINREYCKKLIIMLPGQQHPTHLHRRKEETFQLLSGDLEVGLEGGAVQMQPGDKLLIERGAHHSFTTRHGAVFEEISTTHFADDSVYEDARINSLDPMQRKTILKDW